MAIIQTAYDTTAAGAYPVSTYQERLQHLMVAYSDLSRVSAGAHENGFQLLIVTGGSSYADQTPPFKHPVLLHRTSSETAQRQFLAVDVRDFGKKDINGNFAVRSSYEYAWHLRRAILNQLWVDGRVDTLRDVSTLPAVTYAAFISENIGWKFALDPSEVMTVRVLAAYYYYSHFTNADEFDELEKSAMMGKIANFTKIPISHIEATLKDVMVIHTLEGFCDTVKSKVNNVSLENFNIGTMTAIVRGNWFGGNANEIIAVALEHIPTWLSVVASSLSSAVYRRSNLAKIAQRFDKNGLGTSLITSLEVLLGGAQAVKKPDGQLDLIYAEQFSN